METQQGFSLSEVLISLLLITGTLLTLLKQHWQITQSLNQVHLRVYALMALDNASEHFMVGDAEVAVDERFQLKISTTAGLTSLQLNWETPSSPEKRGLLQRQLVLL